MLVRNFGIAEKNICLLIKGSVNERTMEATNGEGVDVIFGTAYS